MFIVIPLSFEVAGKHLRWTPFRVNFFLSPLPVFSLELSIPPLSRPQPIPRKTLPAAPFARSNPSPVILEFSPSLLVQATVRWAVYTFQFMVIVSFSRVSLVQSLCTFLCAEALVLVEERLPPRPDMT